MSRFAVPALVALFATALGLFTAIPLVFSHVMFKEGITKFENKMKVASHKLVTLVMNFKKDPRLLDRPKEKDKEKGKDEDEDGRPPAAEAKPVREGRRG